MFDTPILYIIFNRLDTVKQTFPQIRKQQPIQLFIAADGPRITREGEAEKCAAVREWVMGQIDWQCDVHTLFRDENLGCGKNVSAAITWFFENVDAGIILEDDCLPSDSFFSYCAELLDYYKSDERIMHIAGSNHLIDSGLDESYWFACVQHCWGWASWKRAWKNYSFNVDDYTNVLTRNKYFSVSPVKKYWEAIFLQMAEHKIDTWDYQWTFHITRNNGLCINPTKNLVTNIGFTAEGTHFSGAHPELEFERFEIPFPIVHPKKIEPNWKNVRKDDKVSFGIDVGFSFYIKNFKSAVKGMIKSILRKLGLFDIAKRTYHKINNT